MEFANPGIKVLITLTLRIIYAAEKALMYRACLANVLGSKPFSVQFDQVHTLFLGSFQLEMLKLWAQVTAGHDFPDCLPEKLLTSPEILKGTSALCSLQTYFVPWVFSSLPSLH